MSGMLIPSHLRRAFLLAVSSISIVLVAPLSSPAQSVPAKAQVEDVLKGLSRSHGLGPVAVSPDGALLAYVRRSKDGTELVLAPFSDPAKATRVTAAKKDGARCSDSDPAW